MQWEYAQMRALISYVPPQRKVPMAMEIWTFPEGKLKVEKVKCPKFGGGDESLILQLLSKLGEEGWELVWVDTTTYKSDSLYQFFFKRPRSKA